MGSLTVVNRRLFPLLIGLVIAVVLFASIEVDQTYATIRDISPIPFGIATTVIAGAVMVRTLRWHSILRIFGATHPFSVSLQIALIGRFLGAVTPGRVGEVARFFYLPKSGPEWRERRPMSVILDLVFDMSGLLVAGLVVMIWAQLTSNEAASPSLFFVYALVISTGFVGAWIYRTWLIDALIDILVRFRFDSGASFIAQSGQLIDSLTTRDISRLGVLTAGVWVCLLVANVFLANALKIDLPVSHILLASLLGNFIAALPISFSGFGTRELALIWVFGLFGAPAHEAVSLGLVTFFLNMLVVGCGGVIFFLRHLKSGMG